jgi:uncharacterized membrane protein YsdA (DUF1294 family)
LTFERIDLNSMVKDYYQILKLKQNASNAEINQAYHQQRQAWSNYLNTADPKGRLKAKQMLKELAIAKKALLKTKGYRRNQRPSRPRQANRQKSLLTQWLKRGSKIIVKGVQGAAISLLEIVTAFIWAIAKVVFQILATIFLINLFCLGLGGLILFVIGIHEHQLLLAAQGIACNYFSMGVVTYAAYKQDKRKAELGLWRTPEKRLHHLELLGGCIGAFFGQVIIPHKSSKASYQKVYWLIVFFQVSMLLHLLPPSLPFTIPQKYILMLNAFLLFVSFTAIGSKDDLV